MTDKPFSLPFNEAASPAPDYAGMFIKRLLELDRSKNAYEKFRDFCELAFCAYAKPIMLGLEGKEEAERLESRYMDIVATYRNKDTIRAYPEMLAWVIQGVNQRGQDFLGSVASQAEFLDSRNGQFFTPYQISRLAAEMTMGDVSEQIKEKGYITLQEPASGAGGMILAAADTMERQGFNPSEHLLVHATDISPMCFHMTYLQLTFRNIPAQVVHGNTLSLEVFQSVWTSAALPFSQKHERLFGNAIQAASSNEENQPEPLPQPYIVGKNGQLGLF